MIKKKERNETIFLRLGAIEKKSQDAKTGN